MLSRVRLFATPWTAACQAPLSMEFSRQEYWRGLPCLPPGDLPNPGIAPSSPTLQADSLLIEPPGKPCIFCTSPRPTSHSRVSASRRPQPAGNLSPPYSPPAPGPIVTSWVREPFSEALLPFLIPTFLDFFFSPKSNLRHGCVCRWFTWEVALEAWRVGNVGKEKKGKSQWRETFLAVQWPRLALPAESLGLIPGQGTRSCMPQLRPEQPNKYINNNNKEGGLLW